MEGPSASGYSQVPFDESKRSFWDEFSSVAEQRQQSGSSSSIGTSAMGKGGSRSGPAANPPTKKDEWDDW